jgi:hypothetical protein
VFVLGLGRGWSLVVWGRDHVWGLCVVDVDSAWSSVALRDVDCCCLRVGLVVAFEGLIALFALNGHLFARLFSFSKQIITFVV